jgi:hypothetical protein
MAEVHSITNGIAVETGAPCGDVVSLLERLLEMARAGEITGIAVAAVEPQRRIADCYAIGEASMNDLMLSVHSLHTRVTRRWYEMPTMNGNPKGA